MNIFKESPSTGDSDWQKADTLKTVQGSFRSCISSFQVMRISRKSYVSNGAVNL